MIPTDEDGYVPIEAIVKRFHEKGDFKELDSTSSKVLPNRLTPAQIRDWWEDPSVCDIQGVDTEDSDIYSVPFRIRGRKRAALKKIAVIGDKADGDRIKTLLAKHFNAEELEAMTRNGSLVVTMVDNLEWCTGFYARKQDGVPVSEIVLDRNSPDDGIVHEFVHHLRVQEGRTAFPTRPDGRLDASYKKLDKRSRQAIINAEEKETVAETVARTNIDPVESGYYQRIPGASSRAAYLHDQSIISHSKALKGKKAVQAVQETYDKTSISRAIISSNAKKTAPKKSAPKKTTTKTTAKKAPAKKTTTKKQVKR